MSTCKDWSVFLHDHPLNSHFDGKMDGILSLMGKYVDFGSVVPGLADSPALAMLSFNETSTTVFTTFYHSVIGSKLLGNDKVVSLVYGDKNFASPVHHYRLLLFFIHTMIISIQLLQKGRKLTLRVLQSWKRLLH